MNAVRLLAHYEQIADAPDAVARLRRFILDLAVRGKLVPQNPKAEQATELLQRIREEKERLVRAGTIKAAKSLSIRHTKASRQELPANWEWVPFGYTINSHLGGGTPLKSKPKYWNGQIPWASVKDVGKTKYIADTIDHITEDALADSSTNLVPAGSLLVVTRMGLGKVSINQRPLAINQDLRALTLSSLMDIDYCYIFLKTHGFEGTGLTVKGIKIEELLSIPFPLPPRAEQHRIACKVDELMALCDRLETAREERETTRERLATSSLARLNAPDPETFQADARFVLNALPALTTRADQIRQIRQTILGLAASGRLTANWRKETSQRSDARDIISSLEAAHRRSGGHKIGNAAAATEGVHDVSQADLPADWLLTDLRTAVRPDRPITYGILMPGPDTTGGVPYVRVADFPNGRINLKTIKRTTAEIEEKYARARLLEGDILLSIRGTVGRVCVVPQELDGANITQDTARVSLQAALDRDFVVMLLRSPAMQHRMQRCSKGMAVQGINIGDVRALQLPVPPLAEQHRIVAKVGELMALCDQVEASLTDIAATRHRLLRALLAEALEPAEMREVEAVA